MKPKKSPPKRQGTLFSFFSKKESPDKSKGSASNAKGSASNAEGSASNVEPNNSSSNSSTAPSCTVQPASQHFTGGEKIIGERIKIFWRDDNKWYFGMVVAFSRSDGKHTVQYDDGDKEKLTLASEKFEIAPKSPTPSKSKKCTPKVILSDDDETEWNEDQLKESEGDGGSAYESEGNEREGEMSDDYAQSEDSDRLTTPCRKKSPSNKLKRGGDTPYSSSRGSGAKRLKKASNHDYAITETKSPKASLGVSPGMPTGQGLLNPSSSQRSTPKSVHALAKCSLPESTSTPGPSTSTPLPEGVLATGRHTHHGLKWLYDDRRDKCRRRPNHPEYNPRTLHVPQSFLKTETPAMQQWWLLKSDNMDTVLFFKVGKFYELFHQDADVGMEELGLIYMKGDKAHSGFPEISYGKFADILVSKGYRVARVEQVETPDMLKARNASKGKNSIKDKVVKREMVSILSRGTRTYCFLDDTSSMPDGSPRSVNMILSIKEASLNVSHDIGATEEHLTDVDGPPAAVCEYGICMVDATTSTFSLGQFADDAARSRLRTLLAQQLPVEIILEKDNLSETTLHMMKCMAPLASLIVLRKGDEFWDARRTVQELKDSKYFDGSDSSGKHDEGVNADLETCAWPPILRAVIDGGNDGALALSALGGATWHTRRALIDHDLLSMKRFGAYIPVDLSQDEGHNGHACLPLTHCATDKEGEVLPSASSLPGSSPETSMQTHMVLDGVSLSNLEVLRNSYDGGEKGSLWAYVNRCSTAFGRRLLKDWLLKPLLLPGHINGRLDAVSELFGALSPEADASRAFLKKLPDVERLLSRIHSMASKHRSSEHPESRAIMYENTKYSIRKVNDFLTVLDGLEAADGISEMYSSAKIENALLRKCVIRTSDGGLFPDISSAISFFRNAFDAAPAKRDGVIRPKQGVDKIFDDAKERIKGIEWELSNHLTEQRRRLGCAEIKYWGSVKDRYQLEVPDNVIAKQGQPNDYEVKSKKKGWKRYWTLFIVEALERLARAEQQLADAQRDQMRRLFAKFDEHRELWAGVVRCMAHLDALLSLAEVSALPGFSRPQLYEGPAMPSFIRFTNARHPCLAQTYQGGEYIPNHGILGTAPIGIAGDGARIAPNMLLLTGPNMGGKSTLLRQTCLAVILAQIGCFVPADEAHLTPCDRIFTRIGASDRILAGQSTFFVELSETANILHHATSRSLVILDELGRGTSTFDGTAIAHAVAHYLVKSAKCLAMFATHYHSLVEEWGQHREVALGHMSCLVDNDGGEQRVTFLYKLAPGPCPKSFGINVARLAKLPDTIISAAQRKSEEFESALSHQRTAMAGDEEGRLGLRLLAILAGGENETPVDQAGIQLRIIWQNANG